MNRIISWTTCHVLLFSLLLFPPLSISMSAQNVNPHGTAQKEEGRFTIRASAHRPPAKNDFGYQDDTEIIEEIALGIQWWTLLGEPIEYYNIKWTASGYYKIPTSSLSAKWDNGENYTYIHRDDLKKYPDLLKRYDNLRPADLHLQLTGKLLYDLDDPDTRKWLGKEDWSEYDRQFGYLSHPEFVYILNDHDLMYTRSGQVGKGIVPGSPRDWHEFLQYEKFRTAGSIPLDINSSFANGVAASSNPAESTKKQRIKYLKESFQYARKVEVWIKIAHVEWPMHEMVEIAELYFEYENGEKEPSPSEVVAEKLSEEVEDLEEYDKDDFWGEPEMAPEPVLVIFEENGKKGVKDKISGTVFISPSRYHNIEQIINNKYIIVDAGSAPNLPTCQGKSPPSVRLSRKFKIVTPAGKEVIDRFFHRYRMEENNISITVYSCTGTEWKKVAPKGGGIVQTYQIMANQGVVFTYDLNFKFLSKRTTSSL